MKKFTLLLITLFIAGLVNSQLVTISETHQMPVADDTINYKDANTFGFDAAGTGVVTDKTWDFSALMDAGTNFYYFWETASATPEAASFPDANMARGNSGEAGYFYYDIDGNDHKRWGWYGSLTNYGIYSSPGTEFTFPITAGNNFSSNYSGIMSPFGAGEDSVTISNGSISIQADMQGTVILPTGTATDVLRIHVIESFRIKAWMIGMAITDNLVEDDYYYWFLDTVLNPIVIYGTTSLDGSPQSEVLRYQPLSFSSVEPSAETDFLTFSFVEQTGAANINTTDHTIDIEVSSGTILTALVPTFTLSTGASTTVSGLPQVSGVSSNNYSNLVGYLVTAEDGSTDQMWIINVSIEPSGLVEQNISNGIVYPNPSNGLLQFNGKANYITISDILGKIVFETKVAGNKTIIDLTTQPEGIYILKATENNKIKTIKLIIEK